jgi:hypothetical protein
VEGAGQHAELRVPLRHGQLHLQALLRQALYCQLDSVLDGTEHAPLQLPCCLVGEGDHHDAVSRHTLVHT